jgi:hypothetical protein
MSHEHIVSVPVAPVPVAQVASPTAALFQKAHAKMVTLARVDEQLQSLLEQRRKLQEELKGVQAQINDEFDRVMRDAQSTPARLLAQFNGDAPAASFPAPPKLPGKKNGTPRDALRLEVAEAD